MQREINGKDILLFIDQSGVGSVYDLIVCLTDNGMGLSTNSIDSSSKCGNSSTPGTTKADVTFTGNIAFEPATGKVSEAGLFTLWKNKTIFSWKMGPSSPVEGDVVYSGDGYLSAFTLAYPEGTATFSGTISVSGDVSQAIQES